MRPPAALRRAQADFWAELTARAPRSQPRPSLGMVVTRSVGVYRALRYHLFATFMDWAFPVVRKQVGPRKFRGLVDRYYQAIGQRMVSPRVRGLAHHFPRFLRDDEVAVRYPFLPDLAAVECARIVLLDAADLPRLSAQALAELPPAAWPTLELSLLPTVHLLASRFPVYRVALGEATSRGTLAKAGSYQMVIWRKGDQIRIRPLQKSEWRLLRLIDAQKRHRKGRFAQRRCVNFMTICEHAALRSGRGQEVLVMLAGLLRRWVDDELLGACG